LPFENLVAFSDKEPLFQNCSQYKKKENSPPRVFPSFPIILHFPCPYMMTQWVGIALSLFRPIERLRSFLQYPRTDPQTLLHAVAVPRTTLNFFSHSSFPFPSRARGVIEPFIFWEPFAVFLLSVRYSDPPTRDESGEQWFPSLRKNHLSVRPSQLPLLENAG